MTLAATLVRMKPVMLAFAILAGAALNCGDARAADARTAVLAGGCFWCVEADFEKVGGVIDVVSGYTGGTTANPTYKQVTGGSTGHYEAVRITYDPDRISYAEILHLFLRSVDPTDAGGQFCDRGDSYRTAIFAREGSEMRAAEAAIAEAERALGQDVVTPVLERGPFYVAEEYHQDYYKKDELVLTRRGPKSKANAYDFYREACGRDRRVRQLWGDAAPFTG